MQRSVNPFHSELLFQSDSHIEKIHYDSHTNLIYIVSGKKVKIFNPQTKGLKAFNLPTNNGSQLLSLDSFGDTFFGLTPTLFFSYKPHDLKFIKIETNDDVTNPFKKMVRSDRNLFIQKELGLNVFIYNHQKQTVILQKEDSHLSIVSMDARRNIVALKIKDKNILLSNDAGRTFIECHFINPFHNLEITFLKVDTLNQRIYFGSEGNGGGLAFLEYEEAEVQACPVKI